MARSTQRQSHTWLLGVSWDSLSERWWHLGDASKSWRIGMWWWSWGLREGRQASVAELSPIIAGRWVKQWGIIWIASEKAKVDNHRRWSDHSVRNIEWPQNDYSRIFSTSPLTGGIKQFIDCLQSTHVTLPIHNHPSRLSEIEKFQIQLSQCFLRNSQ
jgi:hypothetical protein